MEIQSETRSFIGDDAVKVMVVTAEMTILMTCLYTLQMQVVTFCTGRSNKYEWYSVTFSAVGCSQHSQKTVPRSLQTNTFGFLVSQTKMSLNYDSTESAYKCNINNCIK